MALVALSSFTLIILVSNAAARRGGRGGLDQNVPVTDAKSAVKIVCRVRIWPPSLGHSENYRIICTPILPASSAGTGRQAEDYRAAWWLLSELKIVRPQGFRLKFLEFLNWSLGHFQVSDGGTCLSIFTFLGGIHSLQGALWFCAVASRNT